MRWTFLIARLGTVVLMTGLALGTVLLIPSAMRGSITQSFYYLPPEKYEFLHDVSTLAPQLTPQTGLLISVESNSSFQIYLLRIFQGQFENWTTSWVRERFPYLNDYEVRAASFNITVLNAFLENHMDTVLWKSDLSSRVSKEFFPATVGNVTAILVNPSLSWVLCEWEIKEITTLAPRERVLLLTEILVPIGFVLAIPWLFFTKIRKTTMQ